jgi:hypothetical protein
MSELTFQQKLSQVQFELKAPKSQTNKFGGFKYRHCEDILEALKPLLHKQGLALKMTDEIKEVAGLPILNSRVTVWDSEGTAAEVEAQAILDLNKKGMSSEQATGTASSYARKYALNGLFLIDDTQDVDSLDNTVRQSNGTTANTSTKPNTKVRLPNKGVEFDKVKAYIKGGGDLKAVKQKYVVTKEVEQLLNQ